MRLVHMNINKQYYTQEQRSKKYKDRIEIILTTQQPENHQNICRSIMAMIYFAGKSKNLAFPAPRETTEATSLFMANRSSNPATIVAYVQGKFYLYFKECPQELNKALRDMYTRGLGKLSADEKKREENAVQLIRAAVKESNRIGSSRSKGIRLPSSVSIYELDRFVQTIETYDKKFKPTKRPESLSKSIVRNACKKYLEEKQKDGFGQTNNVEKAKHQFLIKLRCYKGWFNASNDEALWKDLGLSREQRNELIQLALKITMEKSSKPAIDSWIRNIVVYCCNYREEYSLVAGKATKDVEIARDVASVMPGVKSGGKGLPDRYITVKQLLECQSMDENGNYNNSIVNYGLTSVEGGQTVQNHSLSLRKVLYVLNMFCAQHDIVITSKGVQEADGIRKQLKDIGFVGNGKEQIKTGLKLKDERRFGQMMVKWVQKHRLVEEFGILTEMLNNINIPFDVLKEKKSQRRIDEENFKKEMLTPKFWFCLYPLYLMRNKIANENIGDNIDVMAKVFGTNRNIESYTKYVLMAVVTAKKVAYVRTHSKSNKNPLVSGLVDKLKMEYRYEVVKAMESQAPKDLYYQNALNQFITYLFMISSGRGATLLAVRIQSLSDYQNIWLKLCNFYVPCNLGIDIIIHGKDTVEIKKHESKNDINKPLKDVIEKGYDFEMIYEREENPEFFKMFEPAKLAYEYLTGNDVITATSTEKREYITEFKAGIGYRQIKLNVLPYNDKYTYHQKSPYYMYAESELGNNATFETGAIGREKVFKSFHRKGGNLYDYRCENILKREEKVVSSSFSSATSTTLSFCKAPPIHARNLGTRNKNDSDIGANVRDKNNSILKQAIVNGKIHFDKTEWNVKDDFVFPFDSSALIGKPRFFGGIWKQEHLDTLKVAANYKSHPENLGRYESGQNSRACKKWDETHTFSHQRLIEYDRRQIEKQVKANGHGEYLMEKHYDLYTTVDLKDASNFNKVDNDTIEKLSAFRHWYPSTNVEGLELLYTGSRQTDQTLIQRRWGRENTLSIQEDGAVKTHNIRFVSEVMKRNQYGQTEWHQDLKDRYQRETDLAKTFKKEQKILAQAQKRWIQKYPEEFQKKFNIAIRIVYWWRRWGSKLKCCNKRKYSDDDFSSNKKRKR